jgi:predicted phage-related endonuclease
MVKFVDKGAEAYRKLLPPPLLARGTFYPDEDSWVKSRVDHYGGSDIAGALGMSSYADHTPLRAWSGKVPGFEPERLEGEWLDWGHRLESVILDAYEEEVSAVEPHFRLLHLPEFWSVTHKDHRLIRATPDGLLWNTRDRCLERGVDAKNISAYRRKKFGDDGSDEMVDDYLIQGLTYCEIFNVEQWDFAVLFGGSQFRIFTVNRDTAVAENLFEKVLEFHEKHVVPARKFPGEAASFAPALGSSKSDEAFVRKHYHQDSDDMAPFSEEAEVYTQQLEAAREQKKAAEDSEREARVWLLRYTEGFAGIQNLVTARQGKDQDKVDAKGVIQSLVNKFSIDQDTLNQIMEEHTTARPGQRSVRVIKEKS